jgi:sugar/nucleoside kinase (ribokinase family)
MLSLAADVWVLGNLTIDDVVRADGTTAMGLCGGGAVYAALGARLWSARVGVSARLGSDFPRRYLAELAAADIELRLTPVATRTMRNWALYESNERRRFVAHLDGGTHDEQALALDEVPAAGLEARMCHVAPLPPRAQAALVRHLSQHTRVSLDPHDDYIADDPRALMELLPLLTVFLPSRQEATLLYGRDAPQDAAREFARAGARVVAIKLGGDGSLVCDGRMLHHVPAVQVHTVDPTGAGDAYCGAFAAVYGKSPDALEVARGGATVAASFVVERQGATAILPLDPKLAERRYLQLTGG